MSDTNMDEFISRLAEQIAGHIPHPVSLSVQRWDAKQIGSVLGVSAKTVVENYAPLPDFPEQYDLPTRSGTGHSRPRWVAAEILEWTEKYRKQKRKSPR